MAVEEYHWVRFLEDCKNDATLPLPRDPELTAKLANGDFVREAARLHEDSVRTRRHRTSFTSLCRQLPDAERRQPGSRTPPAVVGQRI